MSTTPKVYIVKLCNQTIIMDDLLCRSASVRLLKIHSCILPEMIHGWCMPPGKYCCT